MPLIEIKYKFDLIKRFRPVRHGVILTGLSGTCKFRPEKNRSLSTPESDTEKSCFLRYKQERKYVLIQEDYRPVKK